MSRRAIEGVLRVRAVASLLLWLAAAGGLATSARGQAQPAKRLNLLMIAVDDLKPALGCYGDPLARSPNIDRLAARGTLFTRAYCQQAVCSPSRNSLLTGLRPDTIGIYDLPTHLRTKLPDVVTLPQQFKWNGYHAEGMGKIFHATNGNYDDVHSWSVPSWPLNQQGPIPGENGAVPGEKPVPPAPPTREERGPPFGAPEVADDALLDGKIANHAVERLRALKEQGQPFFIAVGFHKPHLPFVAPKRYWDLHDAARFTLAGTAQLPIGAPRCAGNGSGELRQYEATPRQGPIPEDLARQLLHGYYACVSYTDAQVGKVLDELDRLGLRESTVVVLWGDHGWHLGDHGLWTKHTNFEQATHAPLIASLPGMKPGRTDALVEFVDLYPSLCELAGVPAPPGLEGTSFVPLLRDPKRAWKQAAFSQYPRNIPGQGQGMGRSIRTQRYRLTEWTVPGKEYRAVELYDYQADPDERENLAERAEYASQVQDLTRQLHAGGEAARPRPGG